MRRWAVRVCVCGGGPADLFGWAVLPCFRCAPNAQVPRRRSPGSPLPSRLPALTCVLLCLFVCVVPPDVEDVEMGSECGADSRAGSPASISWPPAVGRARGRRRVSARRAALEAKSASQREDEHARTVAVKQSDRRAPRFRARRRCGSDTSDSSGHSTSVDSVGAGSASAGADGAVCACCKMARGELAIHYRVNSCIGALPLLLPRGVICAGAWR